MNHPPICCRGTPQRQPDGALVYKCGHVYREVMRLVEPKPVRKPVKSAKGAKAA